MNMFKAGRLTNQSNQSTQAQEGDQEPDYHSDRAPERPVTLERGEPSKRNISAALQA